MLLGCAAGECSVAAIQKKKEQLADSEEQPNESLSSMKEGQPEQIHTLSMEEDDAQGDSNAAEASEPQTQSAQKCTVHVLSCRNPPTFGLE